MANTDQTSNKLVSESSTRLRRLDRDERSMKILHDKLNGSGSFAWTIQLSQAYNAAHLQNTLNQIVVHTQSLRVAISQTSPAYFFEWQDSEQQAQPFTIRHYHRNNSDDWKTIAEAELNETFETNNGPLWRLAVIQDDAQQDWELLFICHHILADGFSSMRLIHQLLSGYAQTSFNPQALGLSTGFPVPIDTLIPQELKGASGLKATILCLLDTTKKMLPQLPARRAFKGSAKTNTTAYVHGSLNSEQSKKLKEAAKANQAGMHGTLLAAQMMAAAQLYNNKTPVISCVTTVNMRPRLPQQANEHLALRVGFLLHAEKIKADTDFWALARRLSSDVKQQIDKDYDKISGAVAHQQIKLQSLSPKLLLNNVQLANLGPLLIEEQYDELNVRGVQCMQNFNGMQSALPLIVSSHGGQLNFNMGFVKPQYQQEEAEAVLAKILALLI